MKRGWSILTLVLGCVLSAASCLIYAHMPLGVAVHDLLVGSFGSSAAVSQTLERSTPLLLAGVSVFIALQAGLFNIGAEGQFVVGALAAGVVGCHVPGMFGLILAFIFGILAGGLWAYPAGWIKAYRGGHEVITTIMLNSVAGFFATGLVSKLLKQPGQESPQTSPILANCPSFHIASLDINIATVVALAFPFAVAWWLKRTVNGYETSAVGAGPRAAQYGGINVKKVTVQTMFWSGAIAGLAGAFQVLSYSHQFYPDISSGTGYDALGVALLAGTISWTLIPAALAFGTLYQASPLLQMDGLPKGIVDILLALLIFIGAAIRFRKLKVQSS